MSAIYFGLSGLFAASFALLAVLCAKPYLTLFQGCSYHAKPYFAWYFHLKNQLQKQNTHIAFQVLAGLFILEVIQLGLVHHVLFYFAGLLWCTVWLVALCTQLRSSEFKKPLQLTARVKRLTVTLFLVNAGVAFLCIILCLFYLPGFCLLGLSLLFLQGFWVPVCNGLNAGLEKLIGLYYIIKAKRKLKQFKHLLVIAITGSYGKTSCKFLITQLLSQQFCVLCTPKSYNTFMGICKTILTQLKPQHEIFVVEMGADHENDIKKLCKFIPPDISVLTGIGNQHLATFKTQDALVKTKFQIMQYLKPNGWGVFNVNNETVKQLYDRFMGNKIAVGKNNGYYYDQVTMDEKGTRYAAHTPNGNFMIETRLLGHHQIENALLAIAVAQHVGVTGESVGRALKTMPAITHRLELVHLPDGGLLLDDSFNSNPSGCKEALEVLIAFKNYYKIIITPGMVELKEKQYVENFLFGKQMARVADEVFVVNYINKEALFNGLRVGGFDFSKVHFFETFDEAFAQIRQNQTSPHIILIENDLPDQYL